MTTVNAVGLGLKGSTGSGAFAGSNSCTYTGTPILSTPTATSLTLSSTAGIIGTTTNNLAAAGSVGEVISASILVGGSTITMTNSNFKTIVSITLTAGDWDAWANAFISWPGNNGSDIAPGISTVTNTSPDEAYTNELNTASTMSAAGLTAPGRTFQLSGSTTLYLVCYCGAASGSNQGCGGIYARRTR